MRIIGIIILMFFLSCNNLSDELKIYIDCDNKIFVEGERVLEERFNVLIKDHYAKNKFNKATRIKVCTKASVNTLVKIKTTMKAAILELRNEYAEKKFKKNIDSLTGDELKEVNKAYPLKVNFLKSE